MSKKSSKFVVSTIDQKLARFEQTHKNTPQEQAEVDKAKAIAKLRDQVNAKIKPEPTDQQWQDF